MSNVFTDIDNTELKMDENEKKKELMKNSNVVDDITVTNVTLDNIQGHAVDMFIKNSDGGITKVDGLNVTPEFAALAANLFKGYDDTDVNVNVQALMMMTEIWTPPEENDKTSADTETDTDVYKGDTDTNTDTNTDTAKKAKKVTSKKDNTGKLQKKPKKDTSKEPKKQKKNVTFTASFGDITFSADF